MPQIVESAVDREMQHKTKSHSRDSNPDRPELFLFVIRLNNQELDERSTIELE